jgi:uncharacterized protein (DUF2249 family)
MTADTASRLDANKMMDVRLIPCSIKHDRIIRMWVELPPCDCFILLNGHDPEPLYHQFAAEYGDALRWEYLERGPVNFRVKISKVRALAAGAEPGACGCSGH